MTGFLALPEWGIISDPSDQVVPAGGTARFSVLTDGPSGVTYQWQKQIQTNIWMDLSSATSSELILDPVSSGEAGVYRVVVRHSNKLRTSFSASLRVVERPELKDVLIKGGGIVSFILRGEPGYVYLVETSPDLIDWTVWQMLPNFSGEIELAHQIAESNARFFRVTLKHP